MVAHTETLQCERPPQRRLRLRIPSFVRRGLCTSPATHSLTHFCIASGLAAWILHRHEDSQICRRRLSLGVTRFVCNRTTIRRRFCSCNGRHAPEPRSWRLAHVAPDVERLGLQPDGSDQSLERSQFENGLDSRHGARHPGSDAARLSRRPVFAESKRLDPGVQRRHGRPTLGIQARVERRRHQDPAGAEHQPQSRHLRQHHHRHQRRRLRLRARCKLRKARLGEPDPRHEREPGAGNIRAHHRERENLFRPRLRGEEERIGVRDRRA